MDEETRKKPGAPKGSHNARTHGFYAKALDEEEQLNFKQATEVEGLDSEIALLRVKIQSLIARDPENLKLMTQAIHALARLVMTKYNISKTDKKSMKEAILNVFKNIVLPGGVSILQFLKK